MSWKIFLDFKKAVLHSISVTHPGRGGAGKDRALETTLEYNVWNNIKHLEIRIKGQ